MREPGEKRTQVVTRSLFRKHQDVQDCLSLLGFLFETPETYGLERGAGGLFHSRDVLDALAEQNQDLGYLTENHLGEVFLRDTEGLLRIEQGLIGRRTDNFVEPPKILYFGTTARYADQMRRRGIQSLTKRYIRLYDTQEEAERFSKRFSTEEDPSSVLCIAAGDAYAKGIKFSASGRPGEYMTTQISPVFIMASEAL